MNEPNTLRWNRDDVRLFCDAINWFSNVPFARIPQPHISDETARDLERLLSLSLAMLHGDIHEISFELDERTEFSGPRLQCTETDFRLILLAVESFADELIHSPAEIRIVTGLPASRLADLRRRLRRFADGREFGEQM